MWHFIRFMASAIKLLMVKNIHQGHILYQANSPLNKQNLNAICIINEKIILPIFIKSENYGSQLS